MTHHIDTKNKQIRVSYITEQTSHHPPVSAFFVDCPVKGLSARGFDQLSAKFTGTSIRVTPGAHNLGIFINLKNRDDEEYQLTHPIAHLGGMLRGSLSVTVADSCFVTCRKTKIKAILHYLEESWLGKTQNKVNGVIYTYDPENDNKTRIKDVPEKDVLARLEGCWHDQIFYTLQGSKVKFSLFGPPRNSSLIIYFHARIHRSYWTSDPSFLPPKSFPLSTNNFRMNLSVSGLASQRR